MKILRMIAAVATLATAAGCAYPRHYTSTGPYYSQVDLDRALETSLRARLDQYGQLGAAASNVSISAQNGAVTLSGPVPTEQDRQMIDALARNTSGVTSVIDQMQPGVAPTSTFGQPPRVYVVPPVEVRTPAVTQAVPAPGLRIQPATDADKYMADTIADAFRSGAIPLSAADNITATVRGPVVYLQGLVTTEGERQAIRSAIEHVAGVSAVYDQLQVR